MVKANLTEQEWELIETIRNFNRTKSYKYSYDLETFVKELFERMLEI